jgi:uncharacterized protein
VPIQALPGHRRSSSDARLAPFLALLLALTLWARGLSAARAEIPPPPTAWVTDSAGVLSADTRRTLDEKLRAYEKQTGHQVVVYVGTTSGTMPLEEFATKTFEHWKLGRKGHDDGVLILVLARDRRMAIEVGYGLEDRVPDAVAARIIREVMAPKLAAGDPDGALAQGVESTLSAIEKKSFEIARDPSPRGVEPAYRPSVTQLVVFGLLGLGFLVLVVTNPSLALAFLYVLGSGRGGFGGGGFGGGGGGGFGGGGGRSGGGGARGSW